jgi:hypothetical protein
MGFASGSKGNNYFITTISILIEPTVLEIRKLTKRKKPLE